MTTKRCFNFAAGFPWTYFITALLVFSLGHWMGDEAMLLLTARYPWLHDHPVLGASLCAIVLLVLCLGLRHWHHVDPHPARTWQKQGQTLLFAAVTVAAFGTAVSMHHVLSEQLGEPWLMLYIFVGIFAVLEPRLRALAELGELKVDVWPTLQLRKAGQGAPPPLKALILFVSPSNAELTMTGGHAKLTFNKPVQATVTLQGGHRHLDDDIRAIKQAGCRWSWQQLMRALRGHSKLNQVILLGSRTVVHPQEYGTGTQTIRGTHDELAQCQAFLTSYVEGTGGMVHIHEEAIDFTNFNEVCAALRTIIREKLSPLEPAEIGIDVTGGQATASVAGAAVTMGVEAVFQYVDTNEPHQTLTFDVKRLPVIPMPA